ncbi:hypothetical protein LCGC14_0466650 [marine sediment metagenome]|uniref:Uncharacterized protein n=1 Tax=marine sediment metagenome TaxID=412755 RepID=A0A0F9SDF6_9ZZZZ
MPTKMANFKHITLGKFGVRISGPRMVPCFQYTESMFKVFRWGHIFQIPRSVIAWVSVFVVYLLSWWTRTKKGCCNYLMNLAHCLFSILVQAEIKISARISFFSVLLGGRMKHPKAIIPPVDPRGNSFYSAQVADFVKSFIPDNWFPSLFHFLAQRAFAARLALWRLFSAVILACMIFEAWLRAAFEVWSALLPGPMKRLPDNDSTMALRTRLSGIAFILSANSLQTSFTVIRVFGMDATVAYA